MQLREYRKQKGLTLHDIADMLPWGFNKVSRHERGLLQPNASEIEAYRKLTGNAVQHKDWVKLAARTPPVRSSAASTTPATEKTIA